MRYIPKSQEPAKLLAIRNTPGAKYAAFDELREALAREQGYVCAFCMRQLDIHGAKVNGRPATTIAHLLSQNPDPENLSDAEIERRRVLGMTYTNMVLACDGHTGDVKHCDKQQVNNDVTIPLFNRSEMARVTFSPRGQISLNRFQEQIGADDHNPGFLNLNAAALVERRRKRWLTVATTLQRQGLWEEAELKKQIKIWSARDAQGHLREDCQCVLYFLQQKLHQLQALAKPQPKKPKQAR